jgi:hypothetical protein
MSFCWSLGFKLSPNSNDKRAFNYYRTVVNTVSLFAYHFPCVALEFPIRVLAMIVLHNRVRFPLPDVVRDIPAMGATGSRGNVRSSSSSSSGTVEIRTCPPRRSRRRRPPIRVRPRHRPLSLDDSQISDFDLGPSRYSPPNLRSRAPRWSRSSNAELPGPAGNPLPRRYPCNISLDCLQRRCLGLPVWVWILLAGM